VDRCDLRENVSVVLRKGGHSQCVRIGFHVAPDDDLGAFEKQTATHGIKTQHKTNPEPSIAEMVTFEDPKGTVMEVFQACRVRRPSRTILSWTSRQFNGCQ
jgi:hypothetical protein